ncbi:MAG: TPM domain-containing protein, partial [Anaerotignum sp.]|nr:TPM domain-containing protein [Anaerotignum sp.]
KRLLVFLTALVMLFSALPVFAEEMTEQRVFDYAELISDEDEREMHLWVQDMQENWGMDLAFLTTNDTEGKTVQQYGADFYVEQNLGLGENYDGVIFVLDMGNREGQIITCGKAIDIYTDYYIDVMWDNMVSFLSDGDYYNAFFTLYMDLNHYAGEYATYQKDPDSYLSDYSKTQKVKSIATSVVIAAVFALIIAAMAVGSMRKSCRNVKPFTDGRAYLKENGFYLTVNRDSFANTHTSIMPIPRDDDNHHGGGFHGGGSWGGGSSTFSGGGRSFGGGGGKF